MLVVRFKETFRERMPEWINSTGMIGWGLLALAATNLFHQQEFFFPLLNIASQQVWGLSVLAVGIIRIIFLVINGAFRPSAHIRAIGCALGTFLWGTLLISALNLSWMTPSTAVFAMMLAYDMMSLWFASGDAKLADIRAKNRIPDV